MAREIQRLRVISRVMDEAVQVPGTRFRIGLDALLGLIPGFGDVAGGLITGYTLFVAQRLGAPNSVLLRMLWNALVDTLFGSIPLLGDLFDAGFRANARNTALLERYAAAPQHTARASGIFLAVLLLVLGLIMAGGILLTVRLLQAIL